MQLMTDCSNCKIHDICSRREKVETYLDLISNSVATDGNGESCDLSRSVRLGDPSDGIIFEMKCEYNQKTGIPTMRETRRDR